jgi:hypothetical protein
MRALSRMQQYELPPCRSFVSQHFLKESRIEAIFRGAAGGASDDWLRNHRYTPPAARSPSSHPSQTVPQPSFHDLPQLSQTILTL